MIPPDFDLVVPDDLGPVHFIGIGGSGMSGIAHMMREAGLTVTGSDKADGEYVQRLRTEGVPVTVGHHARNVPDDAGTIVFTSALAEDNPEYLAAKARGLTLLHRSQGLHWLSRHHRVVTVAGAHGKTTTTGMLVTILRELGVDPGFVSGGVILGLDTSSGGGSGDVFVLEGDESDGSFRIYDTDVAVVTNVDAVHMNHYGSPDRVYDAYAEFINGTAADFVVIGQGDNADAVLTRVSGKRAVRFGLDAGADMRVEIVTAGHEVHFDSTWHGVTRRAQIVVPGIHNALNAAGAVAAVVEMGYPFDEAVAALPRFAGTHRRFERTGTVRGVELYDDYAHEPEEAEAAVAGARTVAGGGRVIAIHQPHLYSRTKASSADFARRYERLADFTVVVEVDGAREPFEPGVTGQLVVDGFTDKSKVRLIEDWDDAARFVAGIARHGDIVMTLSCGTISRIHPILMRELAASGEPDAGAA